MLIDTHTHLYAEEFSEDIGHVIQNAIEADVNRLLLPDIDSSSRPGMLELHKKFPDVCLPMVGLHPTSVKNDYRSELENINKIISEYKFYGIGETGIDLYWDKTYYQEQVDSFIFHIELALKYDLPLVIHSRKSLNEVFSILKKFSHKKLKGVFHCFPGNIREAHQAIEMGFYLGIGGVVTYKNAAMAEVVKYFDLQHIVLETDAPYLTPVPFRGKRNESSYIAIIAGAISQLKNLSIQAVAEQTTANAKELFRL